MFLICDCFKNVCATNSSLILKLICFFFIIKYTVNSMWFKYIKPSF